MAKKNTTGLDKYNFRSFVWKGKAEDRFRDGIQRLPKNLQDLARLLPELDPHESHKLTEILGTPSPKNQAIQQLYGLSNNKLLQLMEAYFPKLAPEVSRAWNLVGRLRVSRGNQSCFQYPPNHPFVRAAQARWLIDLIQATAKVRSEVLTPEWLAVWGAHLDDTNHAGLLAMLGLSQFGSSGQTAVGVLLASCLSSRSTTTNNVLDTFKLLAEGRHPIGGSFGGQVTVGLMLAENREANNFVLHLLETSDDAGLISSIVNAAKTAKVETLHEVLGAIVRRDLWKLPAIRTSIAGWLSLNEESLETDEFGQALGWLRSLIGEEGLLAIEWQAKEIEAPIWLLWAEGVRDVRAMIERATSLLQSGNAKTRMAAAGTLSLVGNPDAFSAWHRILSDADPEVALWAVNWPDADLLPDDPSERLAIRTQLTSLPKRLRKAKSKLKSHFENSNDFENIIGVIEDLLPLYMLDAPIEDLLPYCAGSTGYDVLTHRLNQLPIETVDQREVLFGLLGRSQEYKTDHSIQEAVVKKLVQSSLETSELAKLEKQWLANEYSSALKVLRDGYCAAKDEILLPVVKWLLESKKQGLRVRGLEFLQNMVDSNRRLPWVKSQMTRFQERFPVPSSMEKYKVQKLLTDTRKVTPEAESNAGGEEVAIASSVQRLANTGAQGSMEPSSNALRVIETPGTGAWLRARNGALDAKPKRWPQPTPIKVQIATEAVLKLFAMLSKLAHKEATTEELLEAIKKRTKDCRDRDGLELLRLFWYCINAPSDYFVQWLKASKSRTDWLALVRCVPVPKRVDTSQLQYVVHSCLWSGKPAETSFHLDYLSAVFASIPAADISGLANDDWRAKNEDGAPRRMRELLNEIFKSFDSADNGPQEDALFSRFWKISAWLDYPCDDAKLLHREKVLVLRAFGLGIASDGDLYEELMPQHQPLSVFEPPAIIKRYGYNSIEAYESAVSRLIHDLVAVEFGRVTDVMGEYTEKVQDIKSLVGLDYLVAILTELTSTSTTGKSGPSSCFAKPGGSFKTRLSRLSTRTHLLRVTLPRQIQTCQKANSASKSSYTLLTPLKSELDAFCLRLKPLGETNKLTDQRLVELVCMAPQWAWHVEHLLGWKGIAEAVLWLHSCALTEALDLVLDCDGYIQAAESEYEQIEKRTLGIEPADLWSRQREIKRMAFDRLLIGLCGKKTQSRVDEFDETEYFVAEPTKLDWGRSIQSKLGAERWQLFSDASVYSEGAGEVASLLQKISGKSERVVAEKLPSIAQVIEDIEIKHRKAALDFIGRIPLATGKAREADLMRRVTALASYRRFYSPKVGGMYRFSAEAAIELVDIAFESLAALAGIEDPRMLYWLAGNALPDRIASQATFEKSGCKVVLELDASGAPVVRVWEKGKLARSIPTKFKSEAKLQQLQALKEECKMLHAASRDYLESAMISGTIFTIKGLAPYLKNPIVKRMLEQTVMVIDSGAKKSKKPTLGYLKQGRSPALLDCQGNSVPIENSTELRVAHPVDFFATGQWLAWKCLLVEEQLPEVFRQVTRELFSPTEAERDRVVPRAEKPFDISDESAMAECGLQFGVVRFADYPAIHDQFVAILKKAGWQNLWSDYYQAQWGTIRAIATVHTDDFGHAACSTILFFETNGVDSTEYCLISIESVPPRIFSEALRQVNTAVRGATPKSTKSKSKSTEASSPIREDVIALRLQLLQEQLSERKLKNVTIDGSTATIVGKLDTYVLDIVSAETKRKSKKLFYATPNTIPPADPRFLTIDQEFPNTTYVVSLAIHLANDDKIREPALIDQLRRT